MKTTPIVYDFTGCEILRGKVVSGICNCIESIEPTDELAPVHAVVEIDWYSTHSSSGPDSRTPNWIWLVGRQLAEEQSAYRIVDYSVQHVEDSRYQVTIELRPAHLIDLVR